MADPGALLRKSVISGLASSMAVSADCESESWHGEWLVTAGCGDKEAPSRETRANGLGKLILASPSMALFYRCIPLSPTIVCATFLVRSLL